MDSLTIVLGLGNPGAAYRSTRHNLGFWALERLAERCGIVLGTEGELRRYARTGRGRISGADVVLAEPRTYMNRSGRAAAALCRVFDVSPANLVVVHDDADLELGRLRVRPGGSTGGHNGIRSLVEVLGERDFRRVRLGIRGRGRDERELVDYVLEPFEEDEREVAERLAALGAEAIEFLLTRGLSETMNRYNGVSVAGETGARPGEP